MTRDHKFESLSLPIVSSVIYRAMYREIICCIHTSSPNNSEVKGRGRVYNISWVSHRHKFLVKLVSCKQMVIAPGYIIIVELCTSIILITYFLISGLLFSQISVWVEIDSSLHTSETVQ